MSGYCPAGKCECEMHSGINCNVRPADPLHINPAYQEPIEVCPYPSRQVPVEPPENLTDTANIIDRAYAAGFRAALQQCREAVEKLLPDFLVGVDCSGGFNKPIHLVEVGAYKMGTILAAISKVEEGMK